MSLGRSLIGEGAVFASFTGGEIFLRGDAVEILQEYRDAGLVCEVKTNGTLLRDDTLHRLAELQLSDLQISVYELPLDDRFGVGTRYSVKRVMASAASAVQLGIPVTLSVLVGPHNIHQLHAIDRQLAATGAQVFYSAYITPRRATPDIDSALRLSPTQLRDRFLPFLKATGRFETTRRFRDFDACTPICWAGRTQLAVSPEGDVTPCLDLRWVMGNVRSTPLDEVVRRMRQEMARYSTSDLPSCAQCSVRDFCDSCIGVAFAAHGDPFRPFSHRCAIAEAFAPKGGEN